MHTSCHYRDEIGIIFTNEERSPTPIHTEGNCIGVEKWCVKYLYTYAYHEFMTLSLESDHEQVDELSRYVLYKFFYRSSVALLLIQVDQ